MSPEPARRAVYRVAELAAFLNRSEATIRREIRDGRLRARKLRSETVVTEADLHAYLDALPDAIDTAPEVIETVAAPAPKADRRRVVRLLDVNARPAAEIEDEEAS